MATIYIQDQNYEGSYGLSDFQVKCTVLGFLGQSLPNKCKVIDFYEITETTMMIDANL